MKSQQRFGVAGVVFLLFSLFLTTIPISVANAGGKGSRVERVAGERTEGKITEIIKYKPPTPPPKKEYEIVVGTATVLPSEVVIGFPWSSLVIVIIKIRDKASGEFVSLPEGTEIYFKIHRYYNNSDDEGEDGEGGDEIPFSQDHPYVVSKETMEVQFLGPQIVSRVGGEVSINDDQCSELRVRVRMG